MTRYAVNSFGRCFSLSQSKFRAILRLHRGFGFLFRHSAELLPVAIRRMTLTVLGTEVGWPASRRLPRALGIRPSTRGGGSALGVRSTGWHFPPSPGSVAPPTQVPRGEFPPGLPETTDVLTSGFPGRFVGFSCLLEKARKLVCKSSV